MQSNENKIVSIKKRIVKLKSKHVFLFYRTGTNIVINAGRKQCRNHLDILKGHLNETLVKVKQILTNKVSQEGDNNLAELQVLLIMPIIEKIKGVLQDLLVCFLF